MLIEVTLKDIANGTAQDECNCPIALAVARAASYELPDECIEPNIIATVHEGNIQIFYDDGNKIDLELEIVPKELTDWSIINDFISRYDNGKKVNPFDMEFVVRQN